MQAKSSWVGQFVQAVQIDGLQTVSGNQLPTPSAFSVKVGQRFSLDAIKRDIDLLYLSGYFNKVNYAVTPTENGVFVVIGVSENAVIRQVVITGCSVFSAPDLAGSIKSKAGQVLNIKDLREDIVTLQALYSSRGYDLFKVLSATQTPDADLVFDCAEGRIETLPFTELSTIQEFAIRREMSQSPGKIFNTNAIRNDRERLLKLGYFSDIDPPVLSPGTTSQDIKMSLRFHERKANLLDVGLEQSDILLAFVKGTFNHVLLHTDVLTAKAQLNFQSGLSLRSYSIRYFQPWFMNVAPITFAVGGWTQYTTIEKLNNTITPNKREGADIVFGFPLIRDTLIFSPKIKFETILPTTVPFTPYSKRSISGLLSFSTIDSANNPSKGLYGFIEYEKGGNIGSVALGGLDFSKAMIEGAMFLEMSKSQVLGLHAVAGVYHPNSQNVPTFDTEGYLMGGASTLRGYQENTFQGRRKLLFNVEYRIMMSSFVQTVLFADFGKVFSDGWNLDLSTFQVGKGVGFRFFTPIGPFRLDFAWGSQDFIIHFNLGQMF